MSINFFLLTKIFVRGNLVPRALFPGFGGQSQGKAPWGRGWVRGGLALVNEHQSHLPTVTLRTISFWQVVRIVGYLELLNNRGRGRSHDQLFWISFFSIFFSLLYFTIYNSSCMSLTMVFGKCAKNYK